jgi:hypothetical protein
MVVQSGVKQLASEDQWLLFSMPIDIAFEVHNPQR